MYLFTRSTECDYSLTSSFQLCGPSIKLFSFQISHSLEQIAAHWLDSIVVREVLNLPVSSQSCHLGAFLLACACTETETEYLFGS